MAKSDPTAPLAFRDHDVPEMYSYVRFARTHHAMKPQLRNYVGMRALVLFSKRTLRGTEVFVEFHPPGLQPQHFWLSVKHFDHWVGAVPESDVA